MTILFEDDASIVHIDDVHGSDLKRVQMNMTRVSERYGANIDALCKVVRADPNMRIVIVIRHVTTSSLVPPSVAAFLDIISVLTRNDCILRAVKMVIIQGTVVDDMCTAALSVFRDLAQPRYQIDVTDSDEWTERLLRERVEKRSRTKSKR